MKTIISGQGRRKVKEFGILMLAFGATGPVGGWHPWHGSHELLRETLKPHFPSSHLPALSNPLPVWLVNSHFHIHSAHNWLSSRFWEFLSGLIFYWISFPCCLSVWFSAVISWRLYTFFFWNRYMFLLFMVWDSEANGPHLLSREASLIRVGSYTYLQV